MVIPQTADVVVGLERTEGIRNLEFLRPGGVYLVNAPSLDHLPQTVADYFKKIDAAAHFFDADKSALEKQKPLTANLYLIGYLSALPSVPFDFDELKGVVERISKPPFAGDNIEALREGFEAASR